jgi:hypothetical protein
MSDNAIQVRSNDGRTWYLNEDNNTVAVKDANGKLTNVADLNTQQRDLGMADVHVNAALTNYAAGYKLGASIADFVAPPVMVDKASNYYYTWDKDDALQGAHTQLVSEAAPIPEISPRLSSTLYTTVPYGLASFVPQGLSANADTPLNPRMAAISRIQNAMSIGREARAAAALMSASVFSGYTATIAAGAKWNGGATSNPLNDLLTAIENALMPITDVVMSQRVWHAFVQNPNVAKFGMYKDSDNMSPSALSALLKLPPITIGAMKVKSNTAGTYGYAWGNGCLLLHREAGPTVDQQSISTAKTFRWVKGGMGVDSNGFRVRQWYDPAKGQDGGEYVAVVTNEVITATAPASGYYLHTCYQ